MRGFALCLLAWVTFVPAGLGEARPAAPVSVQVHERGVQIQRQLLPNIAASNASALAMLVPQAGQTSAPQGQKPNPSAGSFAARAVLHRLAVTIGVILVALAILGALFWVKRKLSAILEKHRGRLRPLRFRGLELVSARTLYRNLTAALLLVYAAASLVVTVVAVLLIFGQFPHTQKYARQVGLWLWIPVVQIARGILSYLPHLFYILVIIVVARFALRILSFNFRAAERGVISLEPWVHRDTARPTAMIVKSIIVVVTIFFIAPLVPGTGSTAARGISIILGLMISFGSTSTVGNFVAGIVLMYMRPFQLGDRVKMGETVGDVVERTFLYTKVLTIKNEEVIVPSLTALSAPMTNFTARASEQGLILHSAVTIGYDAPWRKVHELLLRAAEKTENALKDPKPFVLQTALDDFYVRYQLNVYTSNAAKMAEIYSALHQNIQDAFNEEGVEICSPHYQQLRDGNTTTTPASYRGKDYLPRAFRLESLGKMAGS